MIIDLTLDNQKFEIKSTCTVKKDGSVIFHCEYLGTTISTFDLHSKFEGETQDEALKKIAKELRRALEELLEV